MNKSASNAVYMVLAVALILAASASATPMQSVSGLMACTAAQLSLSFEGEARSVEVASSHKRTLSRETPPGANRSTIALPAAIAYGAGANRDMLWGSGELFDNPSSFSPAQAAITFSTNTLRAPLGGHSCSPSDQNAKYRFAYLKRDPVYVRSKILATFPDLSQR